MSEIERILNPKDSLEEAKTQLLKLYVEDYGTKYEEIIKRRMHETFCFLDTTPDITYNFMLKYAPNDPKIDFVAIEAEDYLKKQKELHTKLVAELFPLYLVSFDLKKKDVPRLIGREEEFINLPIEIFSTSLAKNSNIYTRSKYITKCFELGINPLTNSKTIDLLLNMRSKYQLKYNTRLIIETKWGQRISEEFVSSIGRRITPEAIAMIIYNNPSNIHFKNPAFTNKNILYLPIIRQYEIGNVDTTFLHEARHMVEHGCINSGLDWLGGTYRMLNEARVEKHAIRDNENVGLIFSKKTLNEDVCAPYYMLFPLIDGFIDSYEPYLDQLAINQNITQLERVFGKDTISEYGNFLNECFDKLVCSSELKEYNCSEEELEKANQYIKTLKNNAKNNGVNLN